MRVHWVRGLADTQDRDRTSLLLFLEYKKNGIELSLFCPQYIYVFRMIVPMTALSDWSL
jgi:hypothetical protein